MTATLGTLGADADLVFTPHLLPVARGILSTITIPLTETLADPLAIYRDAYADEPFIELTEQQPTLHDVVQRNVVRIAATMIEGTRTPTLLVTSAIDNLVKGAAGQALQNANLMLGLERRSGCPHDARHQDRRTPAARCLAAERRRRCTSRRAGSLIVVHGGGDEVSTLQRMYGVEARFAGGRRVTSALDLEIIRMALSGSANKRLVSRLSMPASSAIGLSGEDGALLTADPLDPSQYGHVGTPAAVNIVLLRVLLEAGHLPVMSPVSRSTDLRSGRRST
jgi:hypothetical protein